LTYKIQLIKKVKIRSRIKMAMEATKTATKTTAVKIATCLGVGQWTFFNSLTTPLKKPVSLAGILTLLVLEREPEVANFFTSLSLIFKKGQARPARKKRRAGAGAGYFVSLCSVCVLQKLQYLLSAMRSGVVFLFLLVI